MTVLVEEEKEEGVSEMHCTIEEEEEVVVVTEEVAAEEKGACTPSSNGDL